MAAPNLITGRGLATYWRSRRQAAKLRHVNHYLAYSESRQQPTASNYTTLAVEHANLLTALDQADQAGQWDSVCRLMTSLDSYLDVRGYWAERRTWLERATRAAEAAGRAGQAAVFDSNLFSLVYNTVGPGATNQEYLALLTIFQRHLITFQQLGDQKNIAVTCHQLGLLEQARGNYTEARDYYQSSLVFKERLADKAGLAATLHQLGALAHRQGDYATAQRYYQQSLERAEETGSATAMVPGLHQLGI